MIDLKLGREGLIVKIPADFDVDELENKLSKLKGIFSPVVKVVLFLDGKVKERTSDVLKSIEGSGFSVKKILFEDEETSEVGRDYSEVHMRNLRSGQIIVSPRDVLIIGNVNPGAEIVAGGSVVVFGGLYGSVKAGINKGYDSVVMALDFRPTMVQIVDKYTHEKSEEWVPTVAFVKSGRVVLERWKHSKTKEVKEE